MQRPALHSAIVALAGAFSVPVALAVNIDLVTVGDPGNAADTRYNGIAVGSVSYVYQIGRFNITAGQYCEFLNAVAKIDTYGLYSTYMDYDADPRLQGCNIKRSGSSGNYTYTVASDWANRPVNRITWGDAARFCNWLANGQPSPGMQDGSSTEDGSYTLNGATSQSALLAVVRKPGARWVIPTEDEWYKAAYYKSGSTNAGYWEYPTRSDTAPSNVLSATGTNNANFWNYLSPGQGVFTIGAPYYRTEVGAFANSPGPYGTFDQGGNLFQWTETRRFSSYRVERGGSFNGQVVNLRALTYDIASPASPPGVAAFQSDGFRVAYIPEPATLTLLIVGGTAVMRGRRCSGHP